MTELARRTTGSVASLRAGFLKAAVDHAERPALEVGGATWRYADLARRATALARTLAQHAPNCDPPLTAVFGARSGTTYTGILACLLRGHGFVPLNPAFPVARTRTMLDRSGVDTIVVDRLGRAQLDDLLHDREGRLLVVLPEESDANDIAARHPRHRFLAARDLLDADGWQPPEAAEIAYLLFTSGSTGTPKGVAVSQRNVCAFVDAMVERYAIGPSDRFSQTFDTTFDLSVFDMFVAWQRGACVVVPTRAQKMLPATFLDEARLTVWFSVPSTGVLLRRLGMLTPGRFRTLRWSLFCGEAMPSELAAAWQQAAPNSVVENLYGPTELTIACTLYRWNAERSGAHCVDGLVPIGEPIGAMQALVVDDRLGEVAEGAAGELLLTGPQVSLGYWRDPELTSTKFVTPPGRTGVWYRTGDRVVRPRPGDPIVYLGRVDLQVKVNGYRVELGEIEAALRDAAHTDVAIAVGWPRSESGFDGVVAFVADPTVDVDAVTAALKARLPVYMVPNRIVVVAEWPLDNNGKVDRRALVRGLDETA